MKLVSSNKTDRSSKRSDAIDSIEHDRRYRQSERKRELTYRFAAVAAIRAISVADLGRVTLKTNCVAMEEEEEEEGRRMREGGGKEEKKTMKKKDGEMRQLNINLILG